MWSFKWQLGPERTADRGGTPSSTPCLSTGARAAALLLLGLGLAGAPLAAQGAAPATDTSSHQQAMGRQIAERRAALEAHTRVMEGIADQARLVTEMRRHLQLNDELLALMVEARTMAPRVPARAPSASSAATPGGMGAMGAMADSAASAAPDTAGGMEGAMHAMEGEGRMGGMGGDKPRMAKPDKMQGEHGGMARPGAMAQGTGGMKDSVAMKGMQGMGGASKGAMAKGGTARPADMQRRMQAISAHSASLDGITDRAALLREMVRHQRMVDEMLALMQRP